EAISLDRRVIGAGLYPPGRCIVIRSARAYTRLDMKSISGLSNWLEIDLGAIGNNVARLREITGVQVMAVVKANGYGHGLVQVSKRAVEAGAAYCGVARVDEALELRQTGLEAPILVLGETPVGRFKQAVEAAVSLTVFHPRHLEALRQLGSSARNAGVHLKVDTGMSRLGVSLDEAFGMLQALRSIPGVDIEGLFTHFARADEPEMDTTAAQESRFRGLLAEVESSGMRPPIVHASNSAAALARPSAHFDMVRPGIAIYGMEPGSQVPLPSEFQRALTWKARISQIRHLEPGQGVSYGHAYVAQGEERLGVVPVGYGDGYRREAGNKALVHGRLVPVRGRVCMDQLMIDLTDVPEAAVADEVVLLGEQGDVSVTASDLARIWDTLNYEVTCGLGARVPRLYYDGEEERHS
ncbi:MAG: alanine racemase, partial [Anaerolineales bacterium]